MEWIVDQELVKQVLLQLFVIISFAMAAAVICRLIKVPVVIGEIIVGIIIGNSGMVTALQLGTDHQVFDVFSQLGVIFLLFAVGLVTPFSELRKVGKTAFIVASLGVVFPLIGGYLFMTWLGYGLVPALFVAAAMVATSVGITARVIGDMGLSDAVESRIIIGAAVIDDVLGMLVLAVVVGIAGGSGTDVTQTAIVAIEGVLFVLAVIIIGGMVIPKVRKTKEKKVDIEHPLMPTPSAIVSPLPLALIVCFGLSFIAASFGLAAIIGAFLAGMAFAEFSDRWPCKEKFEPINEFLVPFFFIFVGIQVNLSSYSDALLIGIGLTIIAILTKIIGCGLGSRNLGGKSALIVGVGMVPRGEVGLIVATLGKSMNVISDSIYAVVVFMSLVTTLVAPALLTYSFKAKFKKKEKTIERDDADGQLKFRDR
ncbi:MAG TPA: cation:proton antiporter [Methanomassiliicoccales archaeon]|jgi:Kef-type K+ transport system membrane component KefB